MREDPARGLSLLVYAGRWCCTPMPSAQGLLAFTCAITWDDLVSSNRTIEKLGIADLGADGLRRFLQNGN